MPPDKAVEQLPWKWRQLTPIGLGPSEFAQLVLEDDLRVIELGGWRYAAKKTQDGYDLYRSSNWYLYQATRLCTNANAAGHPMTITLTFAAGQVIRLNQMISKNVTLGTHTMVIYVADEDGVSIAQLATAGVAAATNYCFLPSIGSAATASANYIDSTNLWLGPGQKLIVTEATDSANAGDTLLVAVSLLLSTNTEPTWAATGTDVANYTFAASTISAANTVQLVAVP